MTFCLGNGIQCSSSLKEIPVAFAQKVVVEEISKEGSTRGSEVLSPSRRYTEISGI